MIRIFTYGTLKRGQCRNHVVASHTFCGEATTKPNYRLYTQGSYPCLKKVEGLGESIPGEVWEIDEECLKKLDRIEGHPTLYKRETIELNEFDSIVAYFYQPSVEGMKEISKW